VPTALLCNGGVLKSAQLRARLIQVVQSWSQKPVRELPPADLDLAVALGAAHLGRVRHGKGVRIRGGTARAYFIGIESSAPAIPGFAPPLRAMCVAPAGMEEGQSVSLPDEELGLVVGETSTFRFFASSTKKTAAGELVDVRGDEPGELAPVEKAIDISAERRAGDVVPVRLESKVTEIGTLELWCHAKDGKNRWKLEYSVRDTES
jgi:hypothetical protein